MADFQKGFSKVLAFEGGYSDSEYDSGGKTKYGITEKVAKENGYTGDMRDLPLEKAKEIYKNNYWDDLKLDDVNDQEIANELFEECINIGEKVKKWVQRVCNVLNRIQRDWKDIKVDGIIGNETVNTVNIAVSRRKDNFLKAMNIFQGIHYIELSERREKDEYNINGWLNLRISLLKK